MQKKRNNILGRNLILKDIITFCRYAPRALDKRITQAVMAGFSMGHITNRFYILVVMKSAFHDMYFIVLDPINQPVFAINSMRPITLVLIF